MRARLNQWLDQMRTGFWFVPLIMLVLACGLALALLHLDRRVDPGLTSSLAWAYSGGPEGARSLLSTIAGSMITAASVTFSLAAVALSIASQQYGSRVLRNFMRDRITQVLLGTFVATFLYSVLVVRTIRGSEVDGGFVPAIAVTVAIVLSLASMVLLIYFIHHVSASIQASRIVRVIAEDLADAIPRLYPSETGQPLEHFSASQELHNRPYQALVIADNGYLQTLDLDGMLRAATDLDVMVELEVKPGDHLLIGQEVARVWGTDEMPKQACTRLLGALFLGGERTPAQDIRYQFQQLADVVIRALSPGINDPFTAINGIDELASGTGLLARRSRVAEKRQDDQGVLRLIVPTPSINDILNDTVGHIAIYAAGDPFVMAGLRRVLDTVARHLQTEDERKEIAHLQLELDRREQAKAMR
jgi:uncharacterized membrane protein